jgi:hypothetical protein
MLYAYGPAGAEHTGHGCPPSRPRCSAALGPSSPSTSPNRLEEPEAGNPSRVMNELDRPNGRLARHFPYEETTLVTALDAMAPVPARRGAPPAGRVTRGEARP